jgi:hypothetical protein
MTSFQWCPRCKGKGTIGLWRFKVTCPKCKGKKTVDEEPTTTKASTSPDPRPFTAAGGDEFFPASHPLSASRFFDEHPPAETADTNENLNDDRNCSTPVLDDYPDPTPPCGDDGGE